MELILLVIVLIVFIVLSFLGELIMKTLFMAIGGAIEKLVQVIRENKEIILVIAGTIFLLWMCQEGML